MQTTLSPEGYILRDTRGIRWEDISDVFIENWGEMTKFEVSRADDNRVSPGDEEEGGAVQIVVDQVSDGRGRCEHEWEMEKNFQLSPADFVAICWLQ